MKKTVPSYKQINNSFLLLFTFLSILLLLSSVTGMQAIIYKPVDFVLTPFTSIGFTNARKLNLVINEFVRKRSVLEENIELRRKLSELDGIQVENNRIKEEARALETQLGITRPQARELQMLDIIGLQNIFSAKPFLIVYVKGLANVSVWDPVYLGPNTLFGFISEVQGITAKVVPFYAAEVPFNIPINAVEKSNHKGFVDGFSKNGVGIRNVQQELNVEKGDFWVTTSDVAQVPPGLFVGKVSVINRDPKESFQQVFLELPYSINDISYVYIDKK